MRTKPKRNTIKLKDFWYILYRNVFILTNIIIFLVVGLLFFFGAIRAGIFLGAISLLTITFGLIQDTRAWLALQKLQLLTAPSVSRVNLDGTLSTEFAEDVKAGDIIKLQTGDQVPCDGIIEEAQSLEINQSLITGESKALSKQGGDEVLAGSLVVSGSCTIKIKTVFLESRIARMTEGIQKYSKNISPIQRSINIFIKYTGYILAVVLTFIIIRGVITKESVINIVLAIGTMTSMLVPQGVAFVATLFYAYGAASLFRKNVLLQEVNATEKLGRIKNLCMDKTGTLTENILNVEEIVFPNGVSEKMAREISATYVRGSGDSSETVEAVKRFLSTDRSENILLSMSFSSWRRFGAVCARYEGKDFVIFAGPPDVFLPHVDNEEDKKWLEQKIAELKGNRLLCVVRSESSNLPKGLEGMKLSVVAVFYFHNNLREGVRESIDFFQKRGVVIRVISGDNIETAMSVALLAGINNHDKSVTGREMEGWSDEDYEKKTPNIAVFAAVMPEQKAKIVEGLKKNGFTAMVGDGANDALAIKKSDLGIAMFDGAQATRQLASVVLTNNSFSALPAGVELADNVIKNIELYAGMFFNQSIIGLFLFVVLSSFGYNYPLTPFNATFINYFTLGIPGILITYWAVRPQTKAPISGSKPFLKRILPFAIVSAVIQSIGAAVLFFGSLEYLKPLEPNTLVLLAFIIFGFVFFIRAPRVYGAPLVNKQKWQLVLTAMIIFAVIIAFFSTPVLVLFFNLTYLHLPLIEILESVLIICIFCIFQYYLADWFIGKQVVE